MPRAHAHAHEHYIGELKSVCSDIEILFGLPQAHDFRANFLPKLMLIDDQMVSLLNSADIEDFFTHDSHHYNCSVFFTLQNFYSSSRSKTIVRQSIYKVIFNDPGDKTLMRNISCLIAPTNPQFLSKCFQNLDSRFPDEQNYLLIDTNPKSVMKQMFVRAKIFPNKNNEIEPICFFP